MPHGSRIERSDDSEVPRELTPTISVWIGAGTNVFAKVISLGGSVFGGSVPTPSEFPWSANHDHWFTAITDLSTVLSNATSITLTRKYPGATPPEISTGLEKDAGKCVEEGWRGQFSSSNIIYPSPDKWVSGPFVPLTSGATGYLFVEDDPNNPLHAKLFIEIDTSDTGKIVQVTWLTEERHSGFNRNLVLKKESTPSPFSSAWYHLTEP